MRLCVYSFKDVVSGVFQAPFYMQNEKVVFRSLRELFMTDESARKRAVDMQLWFLGYWDNETGEFSGIKSKLVLNCCADLMSDGDVNGN